MAGIYPHDGWPCVYLLRLNEYHKIGFTSHFKERIRVIRGASPYQIDAVGRWMIGNAASCELDLHYQFRAKRVSGEWFTLDATDIEQIEAYFKRKLG